MITKIRTSDKQTFEVGKCSVTKICPTKTENTLWYDVHKRDTIVPDLTFIFTRINETQVGQIWYSKQRGDCEDQTPTLV